MRQISKAQFCQKQIILQKQLCANSTTAKKLYYVDFSNLQTAQKMICSKLSALHLKSFGRRTQTAVS